MRSIFFYWMNHCKVECLFIYGGKNVFHWWRVVEWIFICMHCLAFHLVFSLHILRNAFINFATQYELLNAICFYLKCFHCVGFTDALLVCCITFEQRKNTFGRCVLRKIVFEQVSRLQVAVLLGGIDLHLGSCCFEFVSRYLTWRKILFIYLFFVCFSFAKFVSTFGCHQVHKNDATD